MKYSEININELQFGAYLRKSTDREDKQIQSLKTQSKKLSSTIKDKDIKVPVVIEESKSAKKPRQREGFNRLLDEARNGTIDAIWAVSPDRLSRNAVDAGELAELMSDGKVKLVMTPSMDFDSTPMGILMLQYNMLNAKFENDVKGERVADGLESKVEKGWLPSVAPAGYLNTMYKEKGKNTIIKDPERFDLVRKMWDLMLTGAYTVPEILEIANNQWNYRSIKRKKSGGKPISKSGLYDIFSNPFYYGYFRYKGQLRKGEHPKMVTKKEFDAVQEILSRKLKRKPKTHVHLYTGLIHCAECGCAITATHKEKLYPKTGNIGIYDYYHCSKRKPHLKCKQKSITLLDLEEQIIELVSSIEIPVEFRDWAIKYLTEKSKTESETSLQVLESKQKEYKRLEKQLADLLTMRMNDEITSEEYLDIKSEVKSRRDELKEELSADEQNREAYLKKIEDVFNFATSVRERFENGGLAVKREILSLLGQNLMLNNRKLCIDLEKPFLIFKEGKNPEYVKNRRLEPVDLVAVTAKYGVSEPTDSNWLTTPPLTLAQIFNKEVTTKIKIQLEEVRKLSNNPLPYQVVEVSNGRFCKLPVSS